MSKIYGVGVYEKGKHKCKEAGKINKTYLVWRGMIERCYSKRMQTSRPTYVGCTVCDEWLSFQAFAEWFESNYPDYGGKYQLDKDLKIIGNKIYSPETCLLVTAMVNTFTGDCGSNRGNYLIGVYYEQKYKKFRALISNPITKKRENLGRFKSEIEAHMAWRKRKSQLAFEIAMKQENHEVKDAILRWKSALDKNEIHKINNEECVNA